jgi:hypothetical protein
MTCSTRGTNGKSVQTIKAGILGQSRLGDIDIYHGTYSGLQENVTDCKLKEEV